MDELVKGKISFDSNSEKEEYDSFMNKFSKNISLTIMLILIGTILLLTIIGFNENNNMFGIVVLLIFVVFSVPIFIVNGLEMESFKSKHPKLSNFYSEEEIDNYNKKFAIMIASSVSIILIGVVVFITLIALKIFSEDSIFPVSILMCFITIAVPIIVNAAIQKDKYDIKNIIKKILYIQKMNLIKLENIVV